MFTNSVQTKILKQELLEYIDQKIEESIATKSQILEELNSKIAEAEHELKATIAKAHVINNGKEQATARGEPWVSVLETHVNPENIRHGFFELDWNDEFIKQLIHTGYGTEYDAHEQIVDRWFKDLVSSMLAEEGFDPNIEIGTIDVSKIKR